MSFLRHVRSIGPMWGLASPKAEPAYCLPLVGPGYRYKGATEIAPLLIVRDESHRLFLGGLLSSRARLRFTGWVHFAMKESCRSRDFHRTANSGLTGCLSGGVHPNSGLGTRLPHCLPRTPGSAPGSSCVRNRSRLQAHLV